MGWARRGEQGQETRFQRHTGPGDDSPVAPLGGSEDEGSMRDACELPCCGGGWAWGSLRVRGPSGGCGIIGEGREWWSVWEMGDGHGDGEEGWTWR